MDNENRDRDRPVVDWTSSPAIEGWGNEPRAAEPRLEAETAEAPPPPSAPEVEPVKEPRSQSLPPADPFAAGEAAEASTEPSTPSKGPGRSALGVLAVLVLSGYLGWVAVMCYEGLGTLHARSEQAADSEIAALQRDHAAVTHLLLLNVAAAAPFLLGALVHIGGRRRLAQFLGMVGLAALIYLLAWNMEEGAAYLRETDVLAKVSLAVVAAWFA